MWCDIRTAVEHTDVAQIGQGWDASTWTYLLLPNVVPGSDMCVRDGKKMCSVSWSHILVAQSDVDGRSRRR
jgi:hypothetical protein